MLVGDPGKITAASIPCFVGAVLALSLIPHDSAPLSALSYTLGAALFGAFTVLFAGGYVVAIIQAEE